MVRLTLAGLLALVLAGTVAAYEKPEGEVLVQSWGFEAPSSWYRIWPFQFFYWWQFADTTTFRAERAAHTGKWGLVLTHPSWIPEEHGGTPYAIWGISYIPGAKYRVSYWAKSDGVIEVHGEIYWRSEHKDGTLVSFEPYKGTEWKQFSYEWTAPTLDRTEGKEAFLAVWFWPRPKRTDGEAYVDDVEVWLIGYELPVDEMTWGRIKASFK